MDPGELRNVRKAIVRLGLIAVLAIAAGTAALIAYTWHEINRAEAAQETLLVQRKVERNLARLRQEATSATGWDEAYRRTGGDMDLDWIDDKLAAYYHLSFEHDVTLLFDGDGRMQYAARDGARAATADEADLAAAVSPTVARVQRTELARARTGGPIARPEARDIAQRSVIVAADGRVYLVAAAAVLPADGRVRGDRAASVVVTGWALSPHFLSGMARDLGLRDLVLLPEGHAAAGQSGRVPLSDPDGQRVGDLAWPVARPGVEALRDAAAPLAVGTLVLALLFLLLGQGIQRLLRLLHAQDAALRTALEEETGLRADAQAASRAKSEFIANISHEIRTPLNGVLGMAQVLRADDLTAQQRDRVDVILQSGQGLLAILNSVLDMSKIEAGRLDVTEATFDLQRLLAEACRTYEGAASGKGLALRCDGDEVAGTWRGDDGRIRQILLNLISNAVKFTEAGEILIQAQRIDGGVAIAVRDRGVGIALDDLGQLFEAFSQVDASRTRRFGGTGLGLAISRRLARLMGGDLTVDSEPGVGSAFRLTLPIAHETEDVLADRSSLRSDRVPAPTPA